MNGPSTITGAQLTGALLALGIQFIPGEITSEEVLHKQPARLIAALAESSDSRLRLSLIPLFLDHSEFSVYAPPVADLVNPAARLILQCYYTAAVWLQLKYRPRLDTLIGRRAALPDYFSFTLGLQNTDDPSANLQQLARCHRRLSGSQVNWLGTYEHALQVWVRGLEIHKA